MNKSFPRLSTIAAAVALMPVLGVTASHAAPSLRVYDVTINNLTSGQPLTPPVVATHKRPVDVFEVGEAASFEVKEIAENGNVDPLANALAADKHVFESRVVPLSPGPGPILQGGTLNFQITASPPAKYLSFVSMLICTNDGFTGLDALRLPKKVGDSVSVYTDAYDAGTEINTEDFADIVPPCQGLVMVPPSSDAGTDMSDPALAEGGVITHHLGIQGGVDLLPEVHGWTDPVAEVVITRID